MTLHHSKTWPLTTLTVVQLRIDQNGRTYSTLTSPQRPPTLPLIAASDRQQRPFIDDNRPPFTIYENCKRIKQIQDPGRDCVPNGDGSDVNDGLVLPLSKKHLELFNKMSAHPQHPHKTIRTDTVSTILEHDTEFEYEKASEEPGRLLVLLKNFFFNYK